MKLAHISDIHLDERRGESGEGLDESIERLIWIGNDAADRGAEILLVAGDTFHNSRSSAAERNAAVQVYQSWSEHFPVVVVKGNNSHDGPGEITFLGALKSKNEITIFERPGEYFTPKNDIIVCLPFPEKNWLAAKIGPGQDVTKVALGALRSILLGWSAMFGEHPNIRILLGHVELGAAMSDSGQPMVGKCFVELNEADLVETGADYCALGHIHHHQILGDGKICYAGAVRQCTFGEDNTKGYCFVDVVRGKKPSITHVSAPGRQLITIEAKWEDNQLHTEAGPLKNLKSVPSGSIVRIKYSVSDGDRAQAAECAEKAMKQLIDTGAKSVKLDPRVDTTYRVRSESIREAKTNIDRIESLWESKKEIPTRAKQIREKINEIESEG